MFDALIDLAIAGGVPAYLLLQVVMPLRWRDGWRLAALVPLIPAVPLAVWCGMALAADSNLWPLPFIFFAPLGVLYLLALLLGRRLLALARG